MSCMLYNYAKFGHRPAFLLPIPETIAAVSLEDVDKCYKKLKSDFRTDYLVTVIRCASLIGGKKGRLLANQAVQLAHNTPHKERGGSLSCFRHHLRIYASEKEYQLFEKAVEGFKSKLQRNRHPSHAD